MSVESINSGTVHHSGTIVRYSRALRYGFVQSDLDGREYYVGYRAIKLADRSVCGFAVGCRVSFTVGASEMGKTIPCAGNVEDLPESKSRGIAKPAPRH